VLPSGSVPFVGDPYLPIIRNFGDIMKFWYYKGDHRELTNGKVMEFNDLKSFIEFITSRTRTVRRKNEFIPDYMIPKDCICIIQENW
jgi:hypothetical protein